jgi:hypothetical protein
MQPSEVSNIPLIITNYNQISGVVEGFNTEAKLTISKPMGWKSLCIIDLAPY